jgi:transcriptional regulator with GAF, ATPase, and Fis domain
MTAGRSVDDETVQRPMGTPTDVAAPPAQLVVAYPRELAAVIRLGERELTLGRRPRPDELRHVIDHPTVSRRHFVVRWDAASREHAGVDLGSRNGSRVDGAEVKGSEPVPLEDGSVLRIGDVLLIYEARAAERASRDAERVSRDAIPGESARVGQLRAEVAACARDPSPVLLVGETGTGKEFIAREIHRLSGRTGPFVAINCAALSRELVESQLFGHAKGAFTGAHGSHEGLFRAADRGTLFLDEIGELPRDMQPKLLRALQEREVQPVGETRPVKVDVRVISATLRDLTEMIDDKTFRLDLYARLSPWEIRIPPLRQRRADLIAWIDRLVRRWYEERGRAASAAPTLEANAAERVLLADWPDNLRGLDRLVHRACSEAGGAFEVPAGASRDRRERDSLAEANASAADDDSRRPKPDKPSREELLRVLDEQGQSVRATAKHYGRDRRQIYRWMEQYGIREKG